jgi:hypothetical protein
MESRVGQHYATRPGEFLCKFYAIAATNEHPVTRPVLEAIPNDDADCRQNEPRNKCWSGGALACQYLM